MTGMTIKQIAELCGVSEETATAWAWKGAANQAASEGISVEETSIGAKLIASGLEKPTDLWIEEVLSRAGIKKVQP